MQQNILNILITAFLFCCINFCLANISLQFNRVTVDKGLTGDRYNQFIFKDSQGFIWISSIDGLNRFDGNQIKSYRAESGLISNNIQSDFFEDNNGNIWFSTYEAINYYSRSSDHIEAVTINDENSDYQPFFLEADRDLLWLRAGSNIYKWNIVDRSEKIVLSNLHSTAKTFKVATDTNGNLNHIAIPVLSNEVWFIFPDDDQINEINMFPDFVDLVYLEDNKWLFYGKDQNTFLFDVDQPDDLRSLRADQRKDVVKVIKLDRDNHFLATKNNGLSLYNWRTGKYQDHWKHQPENQFSLLSNIISNAYISTPPKYIFTSHPNKGLSYAHIKESHFYNPLNEGNNGEMEVRSILQTSSGNIWITTKLNGVYVLTKNGTFVHHFDLQFDISGFRNTIEFDKQSCLTNSDEAIYLLNLDQKKIEKIAFDLPSQSFQYYYLGKVFPNRYLVSTSTGIMEIKKEPDSKLKISYCTEFLDLKASKFLQMYLTTDNRLLLPYNGKELWIYKCTKDSLVSITKDACNLQFYGFFESQKNNGIIWAGTSRGLHKIDSSYKITPVESVNLDFAEGNVYGIVEDKNGYLWLTTNTGLWKYNPNTNERPVQFNSIDGLSGGQFSFYNSALYASNGTIWLGNNKGLAKFQPDSISVHKEIPKVYLESLLVNDTEPFKETISSDSELELNFDQNTLTFDIRAVNLYKTKHNKIHYFLEDYDDEDTLSTNNGEKIRYTKIPHGKYHLHAQAEDANGYKGNFKQLLKIKIKPPFWQTWWFYTLCTLLALLLLYVVYRFRINLILQEENKKREIEQIKAKARIEEESKKREIEQIKAQALIEEEAKKTELEKLKNQVLEVEMKALRAQMNPHFLFNSLNSIKSLILQTKDDEASAYLSKFSTLLRSILNYSEKQKIKLNEEIEALHLYIELESLRFDSDFNYQIQIDKTIDSSFIRIPPLILQPFVENAIWWGLLPKTTGDPKLNINIIRKEDFLFFEIEDNGVGRKKASEEPKKEKPKSYGINITKKRIQLLHPENDIEIIDLVDNNQQALGTKVVIKLYAPE